MAVHQPKTLDDFAGLLAFKSITAERRIEFVVPPADLDFDRPFFHMTVESLIEADKAGELEKVTVTFDELRALVSTSQPTTAGMVFHIGRCGSTLVSRMIGHDRRRLVLREASPLGGLHRASAGSDLVPTFTIEQAFRDCLVAFEQFGRARGQSVIVKHSSWESFSMGRVAELLPQTPIVFVYRNPIETVESSLDGHPGWAPRLHQPRSQLQRWVPWLDRVEQPFNAAAIYSSVWAAGADAALRLPPERVLLVDHADLSADPASVLSKLVSHLSLELDEQQALGELGHYSKAKTDGVDFDPQGTHGHPSLGPRTKAQVLDIVGDLPERLALRLSQQRETHTSRAPLASTRGHHV